MSRLSDRIAAEYNRVIGQSDAPPAEAPGGMTPLPPQPNQSIEDPMWPGRAYDGPADDVLAISDPPTFDQAAFDAAQAAERTIVERINARRQQKREDFLRDSLRKSYQTEAEQEAADLRLSRRLGVSPQFIASNRQEVAASMEASDWDVEAWREEYPALARSVEQAPWAAQFIVRDESLSALTKAARAVGVLSDAYGRDNGAGFSALRSVVPLVDVLATADEFGRAIASGAVEDAMEPRQVSVLDDARAQEGRAASSPERVWMAVQDINARQEMAEAGAELALARLRGADSRALERRVASLRRKGANRYYEMSGGEQFIVDAIEGASSSIDALAYGAAGAVTGAAAAAGASAAVAAAAGPGVVPATAASASMGARAGFKLGAAFSTFRSELGSSYLEFRDATTDDGAPVSDDVALGASLLYAATSTVIETASFGSTEKALGPIAKAMRQGKGIGAIRDAVKDAGFRRLAASATKEFLKSGGIEGFEEFAQSYVQSVAEWGAKTYQANEATGGAAAVAGGVAEGAVRAVLPPGLVPSEVERFTPAVPQQFDSAAAKAEAFDAMAKAWAGGVLMAPVGGAISGGVNYAAGLVKYGASRRAAALVPKINDVAANQTAKADPEVAAKIIADTTGVEAMFIDPMRLVSVLESKSIDPKVALGDERFVRMLDAYNAGAPLRLSMPEYLDLASRVDGAAIKELEPHITTSEKALTLYQIEEAEQESEQQAEQLADDFLESLAGDGRQEQAADKKAQEKQRTIRAGLVAAIRNDLIAAGMTKADASASARLWSQHLGTIARHFKGASSNPLADLRIVVTSDGKVEGLSLKPKASAKPAPDPATPAAPATLEPQPAPPVAEAPPVAAAPVPVEAPVAVAEPTPAAPTPALEPQDEAVTAPAPAEAPLASPAAPLTAASLPLSDGVLGGLDTLVVTAANRSGEQARYAVVEADDLQASHNEQGFGPNPAFTAKAGTAQERTYQTDKGEQKKVIDIGQAPNPELLLTNTPSPIDGPPIVTSGTVMLAMGGNGRLMGIKRAYGFGAPGQSYKAALVEKAASFGVSRERVLAMNKPVLVRVLADVSSESDLEVMRQAVRRMNDDLKQGMSENARAVSDGRLLSMETIDGIGALLAEDPDITLRKLMAKQPLEIVKFLRADGLITQQNQAEWLSGTALSDNAKNRIEAMFVGRALGTVERYDAAPPALRNKIERIVPSLLRVEGVNPDYGEIKTIQEAVDLIIEAQSRGVPVEKLAAQQSMFGGKNDRAQQMAEAIEGKGLNAIGLAFREWSKRASFNPRQATFFNPNPTRDQALEPVLGNVAITKEPSGTITMEAVVPAATPAADTSVSSPSAADDGASTPVLKAGSAALGYTKQIKRGTFRIHLGPKANLSTFLHESAHVFFLMMADLAARPDAPQALRDDFDKALRFAGFADRNDMLEKSRQAAEIQSAAQEAERELTAEESGTIAALVAPHEKFARAFEAYLREGKSPAPKLVNLFARFRGWLLRVYRDMKELDVELNDEVRGVFDRMLVVEEETWKALEEMGSIHPLWLPGENGETPESWVRGFDLKEKATSAAVRSAERMALKAKISEINLQLDESFDELKKQAEEQYGKLPAVAAYRYLWGVGKDAKRVSLNAAKVRDLLGKERAKKIPTTKDGLAPDEVAEVFGFATGGEMLEAILARPEESAWVKKRAEELLLEKHPDLVVTRDQLRAQITRDLHGEYYRMWLRHQWNALREKAGHTVVPTRAIRLAAQKILERTRLEDISYKRYLQQERSAANQSIRLAAAKNYAGAAVAKQRQMLNNYLYSEAEVIFRRTESLVRLGRRLSKTEARQRAGLAAPVYRDAIDSALEALGFRSPGRTQIPRSESLAATMLTAQHGDLAFDPAVVSKVIEEGAARASRLDERAQGLPKAILSSQRTRQSPVNIRYLTANELTQIHAYLSQISEAVSGLTEMRISGKKIQTEELIALLRDRAQNTTPSTPLASSETAEKDRIVGKGKRVLRQVDAYVTQTIGFIRQLDGGDEGPWRDAFIAPVREAGYRESEMVQKYVAPILEKFDDLPAVVRRSWDAKVNGKAFFPDHRIDSADVQIEAPTRKYEALMMLANAGNASNLSRLLGGRNITFNQFKAFVENYFTPEDVEWVQAMLDACAPLGPLIQKLEEETRGLAPDLIEAQPITFNLKNGGEVVFRGGYFPARYDHRVSRVGQKQSSEVRALSDVIDPGLVRPGTVQTSSKKRADSYVDVISLEPSEFPTHLAQVVHDLAYRKTVMQIGALLLHRDVKGLLTAHLGAEYERVMHPWLWDTARISTYKSISEANPLYWISRGLRANVIVRVIGYSVPTAMGDLTNLVSILRTGVRMPFLVKAASKLANPIGFVFHAIEMSKVSREISSRTNLQMQRLSERIDRKPTGPRWAAKLRDAYHDYKYAFLHATEAVTATIAFDSAYEQAIAEGLTHPEAVAFGDRVLGDVLVPQKAADQSAFMRDKGFVGFTHLFAGFFNNQFNINRDLALRMMRAKGFRNKAQILGIFSAIWFLQGPISELLAGRGKEEDEDWNEWLLRKALGHLLAQVPYGGTATQFVDAALLEKNANPRASPDIAAIQDLWRMGLAINSDDMEDDERAKAILMGTSVVVRMPGTVQLTRTAGYVYNMVQGYESGDSALETASGLMYGERDDGQPDNPLLVIDRVLRE